jgi:hypothetical protein
MVFTIFGSFFVKEIQKKFLLASMKSITYCENLSSNLLLRACAGFLIAACDPGNSSENRL